MEMLPFAGGRGLHPLTSEHLTSFSHSWVPKEGRPSLPAGTGRFPLVPLLSRGVQKDVGQGGAP